MHNNELALIPNKLKILFFLKRNFTEFSLSFKSSESPNNKAAKCTGCNDLGNCLTVYLLMVVLVIKIIIIITNLHNILLDVFMNVFLQFYKKNLQQDIKVRQRFNFLLNLKKEKYFLLFLQRIICVYIHIFKLHNSIVQTICNFNCHENQSNYEIELLLGLESSAYLWCV